MHGFGFGYLPMVFVWLFWIAVFVAVIVLIARLATGSWGSDSARREQKETAEEILKQRYAKGEITREEYDRILEHIRK